MNPILMNPLLILGIGIAAAASGFGAGWATNGWRLGTEIAEMKVEKAEAKAATAQASLVDFKASADRIVAAADRFTGSQIALGAALAAIKKDLKNAPPLPADCRPDPVRVRNLAGAVRAANEAAAGPGAGASLPAVGATSR